MGKRIIIYSGACMAFAMGSGFASGQEILQFFTAYGLWGSLGAGAGAAMVFVWAASTIMGDAQQKKIPEKIGPYRYYCGRRIGTALVWVMPIIMFLFLTVMFSGAGEAMEEAFGLPASIGRTAIALVTLLTVLLGLSGLVQAISPIGIGIVLIASCISLISLFHQWNNLSVADHILTQIPLQKASFTHSWWQAGLLYGAFNVVTAFPFFAGLGRKAVTKKEAIWIGIVGGVSFIGAGLVMNLAFLANLAEIYQKQIPLLWIALSILPKLGGFYSLILLFGIFTTAVPLLWSICQIYHWKETSQRYRIAAFCVAALACFAGQLPFADLVGLIYPVTGYVGIGTLIFVIKKKYNCRRSSFFFLCR